MEIDLGAIIGASDPTITLVTEEDIGEAEDITQEVQERVEEGTQLGVEEVSSSTKRAISVQMSDREAIIFQRLTFQVCLLIHRKVWLPRSKARHPHTKETTAHQSRGGSGKCNRGSGSTRRHPI